MASAYWVDGYNLILRRNPQPDGALRAERERLVKELVPLGVSVRVYFDARAMGASGPDLQPPSQRIRVCFPKGMIADDAIVADLCRERPANVVVVTDDRELRQRVRAVGAEGLGVAKFLERLKLAQSPTKPVAPASRTKKKDRRLNQSEVEDWMQWFQFDEDDDLLR